MILNSQKILYSKFPSNELYTPAYAVHPILPYIPKDAVVWCPFDTEESQYVKLISKTNKVVYSHIVYGQDFYTYEPENWDVMISNPPFEKKRLIFERALSFSKPICLLNSNTWLNDKYSKWVFQEAKRSMQIMFFDKRVEFSKPDGTIQKKITFSSSYFCSDFLPRDIVLTELQKLSGKANAL